jgi:hypothetical protein
LPIDFVIFALKDNIIGAIQYISVNEIGVSEGDYDNKD